MKHLELYETFVSPHSKVIIPTRGFVSPQHHIIPTKSKPNIKTRLAWLFPTDNRFKNLFKSTSPLNHFKYPFGSFSNFINYDSNPDEKFVIILYEQTNEGENWKWRIYNGAETFEYLEESGYKFNGAIGLEPEEYDDALISLTSNKYNL